MADFIYEVALFSGILPLNHVEDFACTHADSVYAAFVEIRIVNLKATAVSIEANASISLRWFSQREVTNCITIIHQEGVVTLRIVRQNFGLRRG